MRRSIQGTFILLACTERASSVFLPGMATRCAPRS